MKTARKKTQKALGYVRVSTGKQDLSMEAQEEKIRLYCELNGLELAEIIRERAVTGKVKLNKRPEGSKIDKMVAEGVCHIVTVKLDRLFRNAADALVHVEEWDANGIALHLVDMGGQSINTGSSMGKMMITMLAGFAEFERNMIAERTTAALTHKKKQGQVYNHVPYGFQSDGERLVRDEAEQAVIERMVALRSAGNSLHVIANTLNEEGIATKKGGTWAAQTVSNIINAAQ